MIYMSILLVLSHFYSHIYFAHGMVGNKRLIHPPPGSRKPRVASLAAFRRLQTLPGHESHR
jgi:hypothetical protein